MRNPGPPYTVRANSLTCDRSSIVEFDLPRTYAALNRILFSYSSLFIIHVPREGRRIQKTLYKQSMGEPKHEKLLC